MSKGHMFRALVNERLVAAAKDIFTLYKRKIMENEEELRQCEEENQRKQQLLDQALSRERDATQKQEQLSVPESSAHVSSELQLHYEGITESCVDPDSYEDWTRPLSWSDADMEMEQEQLPVSVPESSAHVSSELQLHYEGITENCVDPDSYEDWTRPLSWSDADMETESDGDQNNQVQIRGRSTKRSARNRPAPDTSATVHPPRPDRGERTKNQGSVRRKTCNTRVRTGEKTFCCSFCDKTFAHKSHRDVHIRTHTGEKPYSCSVCDKAFTQSSALKTHIRTHTGEKPYSCSVCDKVFTHSSALKTHIRTHTGEKPCRCAVCDKTFADPSTLRRHNKTHTEERP